MNKTLGSTLLVSGTMIGGGMLAMPLTSAGIGFCLTLVLLVVLWILLTYSALLFVEVYQTAEHDVGIGTLAARYFGKTGRVIATLVLMVFLYALLSAYVTGGGNILASMFPAAPDHLMTEKEKIAIVMFTIIFGAFIVFGTRSVDGINRFLFFIMLAGLALVLFALMPFIQIDNLLAMPVDNLLLVSASPIFFTAFGFHGSIPSLNNYLNGNVKALRFAIIVGSLITLMVYILWQMATHGLLSQTAFLDILQKDPTLNGLVVATAQTTGSNIIGYIVKFFSAFALITSFLGVALGLFECINDLLKQSFNFASNRLNVGLLTFSPPLLFALFYPEGFVLALRYAGQMFAFYAVVLPVLLVWKVRQLHPNLPYRVWGGNVLLWLVALLGIVITCIPFMVKTGCLPTVVG
ncbi:amino acid permease [[Haemophilus] ducreyi]|nr:aromatic amino acid transport family protein [[Haemophilus] ducreyi]AKO40253.1 tyrosine transporter [[Haemophilus] ducreyi]ASE06919.1 amino acid permease [[Haemophilus] ducreyi]